jgi:hypothetical protein
VTRADYLEDQGIIEKLREELENMSKNKPMTNIAGARAVASVAHTDRGVSHPSSHPEQARQDSIQSGIHNRQMAKLNKQAEEGCKH